MPENTAATVFMHAEHILERHLNVGRDKPISYLPIATITQVIGIEISTYTSMLEESGNEFSVFTQEECCINSGAVFAYSRRDLNNVLRKYHDVLTRNAWPTDPNAFVRRLASEWLDDASPILPVVRKAFGED